MNKKFRKVASIALATMMCMSMAIPASAFTYTAVNGGTTEFDKYLVLKDGAKVPNVEFEFTIAAVDKDDLPKTGFEIYPGIGVPKILTEGKATFASGDVTSDVTGELTVELGSGQVFASKTLTVDFSNVEFTEPGVYRYKITEEDYTATGITPHDNVKTLYLDVYVIDNGNGELEVSSYVLHKDNDAINVGDNNGTGDVTVDRAPVDDKSTGFQNDYATYDLEFEKKVDGNQASRDKYFKFTVTVNGLNEGDTFNVVISNTSPTANAATKYDQDTLDAGANNDGDTITVETGATSFEKTYYLQHGQSIIIKNLPKGATYTITEDAEDYKPSYAITKTEGGTEIASGADNTYTSDGIDVDTTAAFTNKRAGTIPTGILLTIAPFAVLMVVGIAGAVVILKKKKSN